jgi:thiol-disulfide isomerase/thioredoxin
VLARPAATEPAAAADASAAPASAGADGDDAAAAAAAMPAFTLFGKDPSTARGGHVRFVQLSSRPLCGIDVQRIHYGAGVWKCQGPSCGKRCSPSRDLCHACWTKKPKSAMVAKSNQTDENGMVIVTALNFADVVLNAKTHCFLDVWASWCGPCRQIAPMWVQLAKILKGNKAGIVIAKMDSDANDVDRDYLPEQFIPVLKLFPKGGGRWNISSNFARFHSYFYSGTLPDCSSSSRGRTVICRRPLGVRHPEKVAKTNRF